MPRKRDWLIDGQRVTRADVRRWMQSVGARVTESQWHDYVRNWSVPQKIAAAKAAGTLEAIIADAADRANKPAPRAARKPGTLARLRSTATAANDARYVRPGGLSPSRPSSTHPATAGNVVAMASHRSGV
jgi:hypothetical protein